MDEIDEHELRMWIRENLVIEVSSCDRYGPGADVYVGLKFKGESDVFTFERIDIPTSA